MRPEDDGLVITLDFTAGAVAPARDHLSLSHRSTTSSRRPGRAIEGTVRSFTRRLISCEHCGKSRLDYDGPHSPQVVMPLGHVRDCIGRIWHNGVLVK